MVMDTKTDDLFIDQKTAVFPPNQEPPKPTRYKKGDLLLIDGWIYQVIKVMSRGRFSLKCIQKA